MKNNSCTEKKKKNWGGGETTLFVDFKTSFIFLPQETIRATTVCSVSLLS